MLSISNSQLKKYTQSFLLVHFVLESEDLQKSEQFKPVVLLLMEQIFKRKIERVFGSLETFSAYVKWELSFKLRDSYILQILAPDFLLESIKPKISEALNPSCEKQFARFENFMPKFCLSKDEVLSAIGAVYENLVMDQAVYMRGYSMLMNIARGREWEYEALIA